MACGVTAAVLLALAEGSRAFLQMLITSAKDSSVSDDLGDVLDVSFDADVRGNVPLLCTGLLGCG
jgi:hypothetical protein